MYCFGPYTAACSQNTGCTHTHALTLQILRYLLVAGAVGTGYCEKNFSRTDLLTQSSKHEHTTQEIDSYTVDLCSALMIIQCVADSKAFVPGRAQLQGPWGVPQQHVGPPQQAQLAKRVGKLDHWCPHRMKTTANKEIGRLTVMGL